MINVIITCNLAQDRENLITILAKQTDFRVTGVDPDGYILLMTVKKHQPDIIIMDYNTGGSCSTDLAPLIKRNSPSTGLIVIYSRDEYKNAGLAFRAGISGFLQKQGDIKSLASSVRCVYHGGLYVSRSIINHAVHWLEKTTRTKAIPEVSYYSHDSIMDNYFSFTDLQIFFGILLGNTDKEIAKNINMCEGAVRNCINRVKCKTGLHNRTQMAVLALFTVMMGRKSIRNQLADNS
ncbi:MAG: response regulator transcription factor [Treponema sp.]|nr:response regulator transcription factor [Treponema sp.]